MATGRQHDWGGTGNGTPPEVITQGRIYALWARGALLAEAAS